MKLLGVDRNGVLTERTWMHVGDDGRDKLTTEIIQDVEPVFKKTKELAENGRTKDFHYMGSIPLNVINGVSHNLAATWGVSVKNAYAEFTNGKTDRAKAVWRMLLKSRDFRKFQAKYYS